MSGMSDENQERYLNFYGVYLDKGIDNMPFLTVYVLYCDASTYYPKDNVDDFTSQLSHWLYSWINQSNDSELINELRLIKKANDVFPYIFASHLFKCKKSRDLEEKTVETILREDLIPLHDLLRNEAFVKRYEQTIKTYVLSNDDSISLLIDKWDRGANYFLPKFGNDEVAGMIDAYLTSERRNPSQLNLLLNHQNSAATYSIDAKQRGKIRKAYCDSFHDPNIILFKGEEITWETGLDSEIEEPYFVGYQNDHYRMVASKRFIDANAGVDGLFPILSKALRLFDAQTRIFGLYNPLKEERLLAEFEHRTIGQYGGESFREIEYLKTSQFLSAVDYLVRKGDSIERRLEDIVKSLSNAKGENLGFVIRLYPEYESISKAEGVFNQIESLMKQYYVLRTYGELTAELFRDATHTKITALKSKNGKNYLCLPLDEKRLMPVKILFRETILLDNLGAGIPNKCNFATAFMTANITMDQLNWIDRQWAQVLIDEGLLAPDKVGHLKFVDERQLRVLSKLFTDQFVYGDNIPSNLLSPAEELVTKRLIVWHDGLFSKQEEEFFGFYLTNEKPRAAALRNKYEHGSTYKIDDREVLLDYCVGLRLLCCLVFKIKKEVELWNPL